MLYVTLSFSSEELLASNVLEILGMHVSLSILFGFYMFGLDIWDLHATWSILV